MSDFTLDLTNSLGIVTDTILTIATNEFEFAGVASGYYTIGTICETGPTVACVTNTGGTINLTSEMDSPEDIYGYEYDSLTVTADDTPATPEPSSVLLLGTGLLGMAGILRKRIA